jgi:hypothetical protein
MRRGIILTSANALGRRYRCRGWDSILHGRLSGELVSKGIEGFEDDGQGDFNLPLR